MTVKSPFARLAMNMATRRRSDPNDPEVKRLNADHEQLTAAIRDAWATKRRLTPCTAGTFAWWRIIGRNPFNNDPEGVGASLPADDHVSLWCRGKTPVVWVSQPYGPLSSEKLRDMLDAGERFGLEFDIDPYSWHYPGWTVLIAWCRKGFDLVDDD